MIRSQPRILVMDSDPSRATRRCGQLAAEGWHVRHAFDKMQLLQNVTGDAADVVLLHLSLREVIELDLPAVLRQLVGQEYLPIVMLADEPGRVRKAAFEEAGVDDVIDAHAPAEELTGRVGVLLRMKGLHDALEASRADLVAALARERSLLEKLRAEHQQLAEQVVTDPLTHLYNVRYFGNFLADEMQIAGRYGHSISLLMLDLDHFKLINDRHGHPAGDYVLKEFGVIMRSAVRASDVVARVGGEEFAVVLPRASAEESMQFAERIRRAVYERVFDFAGQRIHVTCSIGSASFPGPGIATARQLQYFSDQALLTAKQTGRDRVVHFDDLDPQTRERLQTHLARTENVSEFRVQTPS